MIWTKGAHHSAKFQTFDCSRKSNDAKSDGKFEEKPICCLKDDKNLVNFDPSTQKSQKFPL